MNMEWISVKDRLPEVGKTVKCKTSTTTMGSPIIGERLGCLLKKGDCYRFSCEFDWTKVIEWAEIDTPTPTDDPQQ